MADLCITSDSDFLNDRVITERCVTLHVFLMFFQPFIERSACLADIYRLAVQAANFIDNATSVVIINFVFRMTKVFFLVC